MSEDTGSSSNPISTRSTTNNTLTTKEEVAREIKEWMEIDQDGTNKTYENAVKHIEFKLGRPLSCLEKTGFEMPYVQTVLQMWLKKSLKKAFEYLDNCNNDITKDMSNDLKLLDSINCFEDIRSKVKDVALPLRNWCDEECRYLKLVFEQEDLFTNTPRFTVSVNCYLTQFKTSCIEKMFSRCLSDIVKDETNGQKHEKFIIDLNDFLTFVNEDKNVFEKMLLQLGNPQNNEECNGNTGEELLVKKLVEMFVSCSKNDFLASVRKEEILQAILEKNLMVVENTTDTEWPESFHRLVEKMSQSILQTDGSQTTPSLTLEWFQRYQKASSLMKDVEWTPKLRILTKEMYKKFLLPETEINYKEEDGKQIIFIKGIAIFVSKMLQLMKQLKDEHPDVEEIKIVGLKSVHIDCDLDNEIWHGINIGIVTDKLIVDDITDNNAQTWTGFCWNVSGKNAQHQPMGKPCQAGESGGNVHVVCNEIVNGQKWTIVSDGGDGSAAYKWTEEKFKNYFPSISTGDEKAMGTVLTTLKEILPRENRTRDKDVLPGHKGDFLISGTANNGSEITAILYRGKEEGQTLFLIRGGKAGQGGYGGKIEVNIVGESSMTSGIPLTGKDTRRKQLTAERLGVYEASCPNGNIGKLTGDVAFTQTVANGGGYFYGFEKDEKITIQLGVEKEPAEKEGENLYVKYQEEKKKMYAKLSVSKYSASDLAVMLVDSVHQKKAVIRQSLVRHLNQIDARKQLTESLQEMLSNHAKHHSMSKEEMIKATENKIHQQIQHHQLMAQRRQEQQFEKIEQYFRPAFDPSRSFPKPKIIGRRPVWNENVVSSNCLDVLPTEDGTDSLLHCLFGQLNSDGKYVCKDTNKFRKLIAKHIREEDSSRAKTYNGVVMFVLRVDNDNIFPMACAKRGELIKNIIAKYQPLKGKETQVLYWLNLNGHSDDDEFLDSKYDDDEWKKAWGSIGHDSKKIKKQLLEEKSNWKNNKDLKDEYTRYIESPTGTLGFAELEMLAEMFKIAIHVYKYHGLSFFKEKEKINPLNDIEYYILCEGNSQWKRLSSEDNNCDWFRQFSFKAEEQSYDSESFTKLMSLIRNTDIDQKDRVITSIEKFNPRNKTPAKLSQLLLDRLNNLNSQVDAKKLASAIIALAKWIEYYNARNISPLFYLHIVEKNEPNDWECEFILLEMEERLEKLWKHFTERETWRRVVRKHLMRHNRVLSMFTEFALRKEESDILFFLDPDKLLRMLTVFEEVKCDLTREGFGPLSVINLFYKQRSAFLKKEVENWSVDKQKVEDWLVNERKYVSFFLLDLEYKNENKLLAKLMSDKKLTMGDTVLNTPGENSKLNPKSLNEIIAEMEGKDPENKTTKKIETKVNSSESMKYKFLKKEKIKMKNEQRNEKRKEFVFEFISKKAKKGLCWTEAFLCVFEYSVNFTMGFQLRDTQKFAIMALLSNGCSGLHKTLAQVSTGEGKSIIVAGVAIGFALSDRFHPNNKKVNHQVDVITSNDVLALRDSNLPVNEGGLKELYEFFNVTVANNCSKNVDERKKAYNMDVVYGQLVNFQRDYLLDTFYHRDIQGGRKMVYGIIDEVDCMLLDGGNNMLYLSHDIPGMEMLESLYVFIWGKIQHHSVEIIKSKILYDLYGQITEEDLENIHGPLGQKESKRNALWEHLIEKKVIDRQGRLLFRELSEITEEKINYTVNPKLNPKIVFYFRQIVERERHVRIPDHLLDFVERHLDAWLDNARRALELKQDVDYVIDHDRSDSSPDLNPQVIIIDPETGTDQSNSQWGGALHQFLQLKEGCKLTLQSLKAVFISNAKYIKKYIYFAGVSGTLGSQPEKEFLKKKYECDLITVPPAFPKRFRFKPTRLLKTNEKWKEVITEETRWAIIGQNRSIVIFCRSIKEVNIVHKQLISAIKELRDNNKRIHRYTRDYEKFAFEYSELDVGHVIVATNLAGRGTDIKISENLEANGGLHICLTNFVDNERVEEQAMGRAARKGQPGSGILILCEEQIDQTEESGTSEEWGAEKIFVMKEVREWKEIQRISRLEKDFNHLKMLEDLFENYTNNFSERKVKEKFGEIKKNHKQCENQIVQLLDDDKLLKQVFHDSILDKWALWVDETDYDLKCFDLKPKKNNFNFETLIVDIPNWMTPARRVNIATHLTMKSSENSEKEASQATNILNNLQNSTENFFYPAAFYYRAFILLKEMKNEKEESKTNQFICMLRHTESILNDHIKMQISFSLIHQSEIKPNQTLSFYPVDGYKEQKENNIEILQYFLSSIQWLLGNYCSISNFREVVSDIPKDLGFFGKYSKKIENFINNQKENEELKRRKIRLEKVDEYFSYLIKSKCIACKLNDPDTIPNVVMGKSKISSNDIRSKIINKIADDYGVNASLENKLKSVFYKSRDEKDIEKKLEKINLIPCTRKAFWKKLVDTKALNSPKECVNMKCVIISEEKLELIQSKLDKRNAMILDFGGNSFNHKTNCLNVLYNPTYESRQELEKQKKLMFCKKYVRRILSSEYSENKKLFESNKIAQLDLDKLKDVNLESFGQLGIDDLRQISINQYEHGGIWNQLIAQKIINDQGYLVPDFNKDFKYPDCPAYADTVMRLVGKKFLAEIVRQQWLMSKDTPQCLKAIILLPCKPYRDMLGDLMAAHVISGARVSNISVDDLKKKVDKMAEYHTEGENIMEFLTSRRSVYAEKTITPDFFLDFIDRDIRKESNKVIRFVSSELYVFSLGGFDRIIDIKNREWTFKRVLKASLFASLFIVGALASIGAGAVASIPGVQELAAATIPAIQGLLGFKLPSEICKNLLFMGGFSDILYVVETILTRKDFTWADYGRQRIRSAIGKMEPIDAIKAICKLSKSSNQSFGDSSNVKHRP
ncbi:uncharacterized protein LOC124327556 isoform X2 [Daphnia pulicaria]|uniref:uncharacterized protein LOC124327556 isoform X2 n=1 Tax=Daphnia pulicaria TaxID=35523 RepID=UPI001EEB3589|nr:uncharacterized protein LOC124327556 isoform X2 [Daphnia pulicaria]